MVCRWPCGRVLILARLCLQSSATLLATWAVNQSQTVHNHPRCIALHSAAGPLHGRGSTSWPSPTLQAATFTALQVLSRPNTTVATVATVTGSRGRPAVALGTISYNVARSFGPALGGLIVLALGAQAAFAINAACYLPLLVILRRQPGWLGSLYFPSNTDASQTTGAKARAAATPARAKPNLHPSQTATTTNSRTKSIRCIVMCLGSL